MASRFSNSIGGGFVVAESGEIRAELALPIAGLMSDFDNGDIHFSDDAMAAARELFSSQRVSDEETCAQMAATWDRCEYMLDPHSAIGLKAALEADVAAGVPDAEVRS